MILKPGLTIVPVLLLAFACGSPVTRSAKECVSPLETSAKTSTVTIKSGPVCGYVDDGVYIYKGIPYGEAERFMPPVDPKPWTELRPCRSYGPVSPHPARSGWRDDAQAFTMHWDDGYPGEDCLRVNVWTSRIKADARMPVMVWLHGGGFSEGSSQEQAGYDGTNLARDHGVVVVSLNHRLNALGFLDLSAYGARYAYSGNVGMLDIVKALEWVRDNISVFGGDPSNVTIFGQSGGGGKVTTLMAMPSAKGLFHKAIVQSGSIFTLMDPKYSRRIGAATVAGLGISPSQIDRIADVPYEELLSAYTAALEKVRGEARVDGTLPSNILDMLLFGQMPVVDGEVIPAQPSSAKSLSLSKDVPVMVGTVYNEFTPDQEDPIFRPLALRQASDRTAAGCAPVYFYRFDWKTPVLDGAMGSPHCIEIPFVFDNVLRHRTFTGGGEDAVELGHRVSRLWTSFARTGKPVSDGMPEWEPWPATLKINIETILVK
ncbi:MAG: carboxylesterase/lipase family protein [Bacteroidales bacterium]|nr:carboxylesterase/lipase family protein [Bacteroidales bacterium]